MTKEPKIYADFHNLDEENRLRLTSSGTRKDLDRKGITLRKGLQLTFYTDDADDRGQPDELIVEGVVDFDESAQIWVGQVDWATVRRLSELRLEQN